MKNLKKYWYIIAETGKLKKGKVISQTICGEALVAFRGTDGQVCVMPDRCLHRCAKLSKGTVKSGLLSCPYHGWVYNGKGQVVSIPAHFGKDVPLPKKSHAYPVLEQEGYIYVCLDAKEGMAMAKPFNMPEMSNPQFKRVRLVNHFDNTLANCVENFIDIPHTAYVHKGIFRKVRSEKINAQVSRQKGHVKIDYENEADNLGSFSWLLNPNKNPVFHQDNFYAPNITHVIYRLEGAWCYTITSQSVPVSETQTTVYTELCYDFGKLNYMPLTKWLIKRQAQKVIAQDVDILNQQMQVINQFGENFWNTSADIIHESVSQIIQTLREGKSVQTLPDLQRDITFWV